MPTAKNLLEIAAALPVLDLASQPTYEEAMAAMVRIGSFGSSDASVVNFRGEPPWEKHPGEEWIYILKGVIGLRLRHATSVETLQLTEGALFCVPAGVWHRAEARDGVQLVAVTPREGNESSMALDPLDS